MATSPNIRERLAPEGLWWKSRREIARLARAGALGEVFLPGSGVKPPLLVGRHRVVESLTRLVGGLRAGETGASMGAVLYGPRGTGKTGLLDVAVASARADGVRAVSASGQSLRSPESVARELLRGESWPVEKSRASDGEKSRASDGRVGGSLRWETRARVSEPGIEDTLVMLSRDEGCLVMVDEAHMMDAEAGGRLLVAVQSVRRDGVPVAVVLAGTPDLLDSIGRMGASFFLGRIPPRLKVGCGLVAPEAAEAGVLLPLAAAGVEAGAHWRERIADLTKGYPYFIQALGQAIAEAYADRLGEAADPSRNQAALREFELVVADHYETVWLDLNRDNLMACAVQIGYLSDACAARNVPVPEEALDKAIAAGVRHPMRTEGAVPDFDEARLRMAHFGLLWTPEIGGPLAVGIPSFFSFAAKKAEQASPGAREVLWRDRTEVLAAAGIRASA